MYTLSKLGENAGENVRKVFKQISYSYRLFILFYIM